MLQNEALVAKIGFDTAENEPRKESCVVADCRQGAVSFVLRDTFYVLGGYTAVGLDARLHALDLAGEKWSAQGAPGS